MRNLAIGLTLALWSSAGHAALGGEGDLPSGAGFAAEYPGDRGIGEDRRVVFAENFESGSMAEVARRWESVSEGMFAISDEKPPGSAGRRSLLATHVGGKGDGGHLYRRLGDGEERVFTRFYVKFDEDCAPIHHFFHVGGYWPPTPYPQGGAGIRPKGNERFTVGIEPAGDDWRWDFYAYWSEMGGSPPRGQTWGNSFGKAPKPPVEKGRWMCLETMIKLNQPGKRDGELALWVDGKLIGHLGEGFPKGRWIYDKFEPGEGGESVRWDDAAGGPVRRVVAAGGEPFEGFRWRDDERLKMNFVWLLVYITRAERGRESRIWFDDVVVAREYIGPIAAAGAGSGDGDRRGD